MTTGTASREIATAIETVAAWHELIVVGADRIEVRDDSKQLVSIADLMAMNQMLPHAPDLAPDVDTARVPESGRGGGVPAARRASSQRPARRTSNHVGPGLKRS